MKSWLQDNEIEMYSTHNEGKSVVAGRFIRTLKNKTYKYMTSLSNNVYNDKLNAVVSKYSNTYHSTNKMKPVDVKSSRNIDFGVENIKVEVLKFKVGDHIIISKYKTIFGKCYAPNLS